MDNNILIVECLEYEFSRAVIRDIKKLLGCSYNVITCSTLSEAELIVKSNIPLCSLLFSKSLGHAPGDSTAPTPDLFESNVVDILHARQPGVPTFYLNEATEVDVATTLLTKIKEILFVCQDGAEFIHGRIVHFAQRYLENLLPTFTDDLRKFAEIYEYSWTIPGHQGVGMKKSPIGKAFLDFVGDSVFKLDLNSSRSDLGSLLGHSGPFLESEKEIANIFGAEISFTGVVGGSGSNRTVMQYCMRDKDVVVVDRNCHKSIAHGLILTGAIAEFVKPRRNEYGIIGPFKISELEEIMQDRMIRYFVMTNCTFDGLCYFIDKAKDALSKVKYIHYDEAWFAYAKFHPIYEGTYAMQGDYKNYTGESTVFATHSTHKMLNAFGQGSFIHVRSGRGDDAKVVSEDFNQSYMMHTTTSPSYILAASNDVSASMMKGDMGKSLVQESLIEAIHFRKTLSRLYYDHTSKKDPLDWFFKPWNPEKIGDKLFHELKTKSLIEQKNWILSPKDLWHGFDEMEKSWCMLDPLKVTIITKFENIQIPAPLVCVWLASKGVTICRNTEFTIMFLFSMGVTKGKWITLVQYLSEFKEFYDKDLCLQDILPDLVTKHPEYANEGLKSLGDKMIKFLEVNDLTSLSNGAASYLPAKSEMSCREAFQQIPSSTQFVPLEQLYNRVSASFIIPYPPGIPIIISGERFGEKDKCPIVKYLLALELWDETFPGFDHETTGVKKDENSGKFLVCVTK